MPARSPTTIAAANAPSAPGSARDAPALLGKPERRPVARSGGRSARDPKHRPPGVADRAEALEEGAPAKVERPGFDRAAGGQEPGIKPDAGTNRRRLGAREPDQCDADALRRGGGVEAVDPHPIEHSARRTRRAAREGDDAALHGLVEGTGENRGGDEPGLQRRRGKAEPAGREREAERQHGDAAAPAQPRRQ